jgi:hypothetical protein
MWVDIGNLFLSLCYRPYLNGLLHLNWPGLTRTICVSFALTKIHYNLSKLLKSSLKICHDLLGDNIGIGKVVGFFEGSVLKLKDRLPINDTNDLPNCKIWSKGVYDT